MENKDRKYVTIAGSEGKSAILQTELESDVFVESENTEEKIEDRTEDIMNTLSSYQPSYDYKNPPNGYFPSKRRGKLKKRLYSH